MNFVFFLNFGYNIFTSSLNSTELLSQCKKYFFTFILELMRCLGIILSLLCRQTICCNYRANTLVAKANLRQCLRRREWHNTYVMRFATSSTHMYQYVIIVLNQADVQVFEYVLLFPSYFLSSTKVKSIIWKAFLFSLSKTRLQHNSFGWFFLQES